MWGSLQVCACKCGNTEEVSRIVTLYKLPVGSRKPRVGNFKSLTIVVCLVFQIMTVCSKEICHTLQFHTFAISIVGNHLFKIRHHIYRELACTVEAQTCHLVAHHAVAETLHKSLLVFFQVGICRCRNVWRDILIHEGTYKLLYPLVVHGSIHLAIAVEERRIREQRVRSVEQRELHVLERRNVVGHLCAYGLPCRAASSEVVLNDPLYEVLAVDRSLITCAILFVQSF